MDLNSTVTYQGCLLGVEKIDFRNDAGEQIQLLKLHVSTQIPANRGVGFSTEKLSYKGEFTDYGKLCGHIGKQVQISLGAKNAAFSVTPVASQKGAA